MAFASYMKRTPSCEKVSPWKDPKTGEMESLDNKEMIKEREKATRNSIRTLIIAFFLSRNTGTF